MRRSFTPLTVQALLTSLALCCLPAAAGSIDADGAEKLIKASGCSKCHTPDKKKDGPAYRDVAAKFRSLADADDKITHHVTAGDKVKFPDGHEESHKKVKTTDSADIKNLVAWIRAHEGGTKY